MMALIDDSYYIYLLVRNFLPYAYIPVTFHRKINDL